MVTLSYRRSHKGSADAWVRDTPGAAADVAREEAGDASAPSECLRAEVALEAGDAVEGQRTCPESAVDVVDSCGNVVAQAGLDALVLA